jgi:hypothetical protein
MEKTLSSVTLKDPVEFSMKMPDVFKYFIEDLFGCSTKFQLSLNNSKEVLSLYLWRTKQLQMEFASSMDKGIRS